jgi:CheY-like chemotaxis protein
LASATAGSGALAVLEFGISDGGTARTAEKPLSGLDQSIETMLALAAAKVLVEMQKGVITEHRVESGGTTVMFTIPNLGVPERPVSGQNGTDDTCAVSKAAILLVEDNLINQKVVISLLRKKGYNVEVAVNGQDALDRLSAKPFGLVLMDVQMPVLDGLETTRRIRANAAWAGLPVIAMTAHAMNGDRERCLQSGMNDYLAKPMDHKQLLRLVDQYLAAGAPAPTTQNVTEQPDRETEQSALSLQMLQLFLEVAPDRVKRMRHMAMTGDIEALSRDARKLRGAALSITANAVAECAAGVDGAAARADITAACDSLARLESALQELSGSRIPVARG